MTPNKPIIASFHGKEPALSLYRFTEPELSDQMMSLVRNILIPYVNPFLISSAPLPLSFPFSARFILFRNVNYR